MRTMMILSAVSAAAIGYVHSKPAPAVEATPTIARCAKFTGAAELMRLGYASSHPYRDDAQVRRAKALLWSYPGGCTDATFHHVASRLILSGHGEWTAHHVLKWGRRDLAEPDVAAATFETYRSLYMLLTGRGFIERIGWPAESATLLREQFYEARVR